MYSDLELKFEALTCYALIVPVLFAFGQFIAILAGAQ